MLQDWDVLCEESGIDPTVLIRPATENEDPPGLVEVMLTVLDWYASHKQTYRATSDVYRLLATLARYNSRRIEQPALELQRWFSSVQEGLDIRELTRGSRGGIRKNGHRIVPGCHVSYYEGTTLRIGVLSTVYVGSRPSAPEDPVCAVCVFRRFRSVRKYVNFRDCGMLIVSLLGARGELDYVCSTRMQHLYLRAIWEDPDEEDLFALVRMEAL